MHLMAYDRVYSEGLCACPRGHAFTYQASYLRKPCVISTTCPANIGTEKAPKVCGVNVLIDCRERPIFKADNNLTASSGN